MSMPKRPRVTMTREREVKRFPLDLEEEEVYGLRGSLWEDEDGDVVVFVQANDKEFNFVGLLTAEYDMGNRVIEGFSLEDYKNKKIPDGTYVQALREFHGTLTLKT